MSHIDAEMSAINDPPSATPAQPTAPAARREYNLEPVLLEKLASLVQPSFTIQQVIDQLVPPSPSTAFVPLPQVAHPPAATGNNFINAFRRNRQPIEIIETRKGGLAYASSDSALVDLDFALKPPGDPKELRRMLEAAYKEDSLATVRMIFQTRSIHEGKGFKEGFWITAGWLWEHHPRTFLSNIHLLVDPTCKRPASLARAHAKPPKIPKASEPEDDDIDELPDYPPRPHGCWDDLNDILVLALSGQLNGSHNGPFDAVDEEGMPSNLADTFKQDRMKLKSTGLPNNQRDRSGFRKMGVLAKREHRISSFKHKILRAGSKAQKHSLRADRLSEALNDNPKFLALYVIITKLFADQLRTDIALLDKHRDFLAKPAVQRRPFGTGSSPFLYQMSFAAKWASTPGKSADKQTRIASAISYLLCPAEGIENGRALYQRKILTPLRAALKVPESGMKAGEWRLDYTKIPGRCMNRNSANFMVHDEKGFTAYLDKVTSGLASISGASLFPHEILMDAIGDSLIKKRVADLQWATLVDGIKSASKVEFENCLAIADVSGSMGHYGGGDRKQPQPINVCLALTLLLGQLSANPWNGMFFTFSSEPTAEYIDPNLPLSERAENLMDAHWEMSTNFYKVSDLILDVALRERLPVDQMIKKLFIFSDMQFDACVRVNARETEYAAIKRKFEEAKYPMPEVVFWNLLGEGRSAMPVKASDEGVSTMSGFSGNMMKYFLASLAEEKEEELIKDWDMMDVQGSEDEDGDDDFSVMSSVGAAGSAAVGSGGGGSGSVGEGKNKRSVTPLERLKKTLAVDSFKDVVVVD